MFVEGGIVTSLHKLVKWLVVSVQFLIGCVTDVVIAILNPTFEHSAARLMLHSHSMEV